MTFPTRVLCHVGPWKTCKSHHRGCKNERISSFGDPMNPLRTSRDPHKTSQDRPRRPHAPSEDLQRPSLRTSRDPPKRSRRPFWTIETLTRALMTVPGDPMHPLRTSRDPPKRPRRRHVTILDHSGPLLSMFFCLKPLFCVDLRNVWEGRRQCGSS